MITCKAKYNSPNCALMDDLGRQSLAMIFQI